MTNILVGFYISISLYMFGFAICSLLSLMMIHDSLPDLDHGKFDMNPPYSGCKTLVSHQFSKKKYHSHWISSTGTPNVSWGKPWFPIDFPKKTQSIEPLNPG